MALATRTSNDVSNGLGVLNNKLNDMRTLLESERCETNTLRLKVQQEKEMREQIMERLKMMELQMYNNHQIRRSNHSTLKQHNARLQHLMKLMHIALIILGHERR